MAGFEQLESRRLYSAGELDLSFGGGDGVVDLRTNTHSWAVGANDATVDDLGRLLLASVYPSKQQMTVTRMLPDGTVDTSFGADGIVTIDTGFKKDSRGPFEVVADHAGKTLILFKNRLTRLNGSGGTDRLFGSGGSVFLSGFSTLADVTVDANNRPLLIGASVGKTGDRGTVVRLGARGVLDPSFASNGFFKTPVPTNQRSGLAGDAAGLALKVVSDGSIIGVTHTYARESVDDVYSAESGISAFRLTQAGILDTSYGRGGYVNRAKYPDDLESASTQLEAIFSDGSLLLADKTAEYDFGGFTTKTWWRVGTRGQVTAVPLEGLVDDLNRDDDVTISTPYYARVVAVTADNKLIVRYDNTLIRYNRDYSRDTTFTAASLPNAYAPSSMLPTLAVGGRLLTFSSVPIGDDRLKSVTRVRAFEL